jgi:hypothetical protein
MMKQRALRPDLAKLAVHMPQWPYVRESRRGVGVYTLRAADLERFEKAKHFPTSLAMGDYFMDLHRTDEAIETDLDHADFARGGGPFQVPFEVFIPEKVDGLVLAEKNISQSRLVNGATRLQPITILTGQAAGAIAALASAKDISPRQLNPIDAQVALLEAGSTLVPRWYVDVPWGTPAWRVSQLLSLYDILDRPGSLHHRHGPLREKWTWGPNEPVNPADARAAVTKLVQHFEIASPTLAAFATGERAMSREQAVKLFGDANAAWRPVAESASIADAQSVTRLEFGAICVQILGRPR